MEVYNEHLDLSKDKINIDTMLIVKDSKGRELMIFEDEHGLHIQGKEQFCIKIEYSNRIIIDY